MRLPMPPPTAAAAPQPVFDEALNAWVVDDPDPWSSASRPGNRHLEPCLTMPPV